MLKLLKRAVALFLTTLALFLVYLAVVPVRSNAVLINEAVKRAEEYHIKSQAGATNPKRNGYLNPNFLPFWGRKNGERVPDRYAEKAVGHWVEYSSIGQGKEVEHASLLKVDDLSYNRALYQFTSVSPFLEQALRSELFVTPDLDPSFSSLTMNYNGLRSCVYALAALAECDVAKNKLAPAVHKLNSIFSLERDLYNNSNPFDLMISAYIGRIGDHTTLLCFPPTTELPAKEHKSLMLGILNSRPDKVAMENFMDAEISLGQKLFAEVGTTHKLPIFVISSDKSPNSGFLETAFTSSLIWSREERIWSNLWAKILKEYSATNGQEAPTPVKALADRTAMAQGSTSLYWDLFMGNQSVMTMVLIPNVNSVAATIYNTRTYKAALATVHGLIAYKAENGGYPGKLEELAAAYSLPLKFNELGIKWEQTGQVGILSAPYITTANSSPYFEDLEKIKKASPNSLAWVTIEANTIKFRL